MYLSAKRFLAAIWKKNNKNSAIIHINMEKFNSSQENVPCIFWYLNFSSNADIKKKECLFDFYFKAQKIRSILLFCRSERSPRNMKNT